MNPCDKERTENKGEREERLEDKGTYFWVHPISTDRNILFSVKVSHTIFVQFYFKVAKIFFKCTFLCNNLLYQVSSNGELDTVYSF